MSEICLLNNLKKVMANISPRADGIVDFTCVESVSADSLDLVGGNATLVYHHQVSSPQ